MNRLRKKILGFRGVSQKMIFGDMGEVGVTKVPKMDDVIYEQSLTIVKLHTIFLRPSVSCIVEKLIQNMFQW